MRTTRVAVVGAGHLGKIHTRLVRTLEDVELIGVADPVEAARDQVAVDYETQAFADHRELIGKIDAAIIAAPTGLHHAIALELLEAGVHCLIEKPITLTTRDADELIDTAQRYQLVLQVGHVERFNPVLPIAQRLGAPLYIECTRTSGYTFRSTDVGAVLDLMIHDLDIVLSLVDSEVTDVRATGAAVFGGHEDMAQARIEFANGAVANLLASRSSFDLQRTMKVITAAGFAELDFGQHRAKVVRPSQAFLQGDIPFHGLTAEQQQHLRENLFTEVLPLEVVEVEKTNAILDEQRDFLASIRQSRSPRVTGQAGRAALALAEEIVDQVNRCPWSMSSTIRVPAAPLADASSLQPRKAG